MERISGRSIRAVSGCNSEEKYIFLCFFDECRKGTYPLIEFHLYVRCKLVNLEL